eukprot:TRINITY_DN5127_c0_g1_i1.p1 TRINITY_DN5127_c0_g1~~TRINITY_DN5127_c0_g1_i1.p1  ORF type:complete len:233 (-),score=23.19 TRINITY_DN5127_c0_g1_i1:534-1232(-)
MKFLQEISVRFGNMAPHIWAKTYPTCDLTVVFGHINAEHSQQQQQVAPGIQTPETPRGPELTPEQEASALRNERALQHQIAHLESISRECAAQSRALWARTYPNCEQVCNPSQQDGLPSPVPSRHNAELRDPELTRDQHAQAKQNERALQLQMNHLESISSRCAAQSRAIWAQTYPNTLRTQPAPQVTDARGHKKLSAMELLFQCRYHSGGGRLWSVNVDDEPMPDVKLVCV